MTTVIIGTGIIGTSVAFYLSKSQAPSSIHLVEVSPALFASASGLAGGFLAEDWFSPSIAALGALSFAEHRRLAEEYGGKETWGYSKSTGISYTAGKKETESCKSGVDDWLRHGASRAEATAMSVDDFTSGEHNEPKWLKREDGDNIEIISKDGSTAQVDPLKLSQHLLSECLAHGVKLHHPAKPISVSKDMCNELSSIRVASTDSSLEIDIPCTRLIITAGAWSAKVFQALFPESKIKLPITSLAGHSLVVRSPRWKVGHDNKGCHAVFTADDAGFSPELFSRIGGVIYVAGLNSSSSPLPVLATESKIDEEAMEKLQRTTKRLLGLPGDVDDLEVISKGLCFRPVTGRGTPILSRIPDAALGRSMKTRGADEGGVFIAAGHGPWGISMSLGTGKVMAEMVQGLPTSADVTELGL